MKHSQGAGVRGAVTDMRVLKESVLESNVVGADVWEQQAAVHRLHGTIRVPGNNKRYLCNKVEVCL